MKADWDKLGKIYAKSDSVAIVDVDCTAGGEQTCQKHGVKGYPTIKYFMNGSKKGQDYQQGRDFNSLKSFAEKTLDVAKCDAKTGKNCREIEKKFIEANKDKSKDELSTLLAEKTAAHKASQAEKKAAEKEFKAKQKEFVKDEKKFKMAEAILKQLEKLAN